MNERIRLLAEQARNYANDEKAYRERIHNRELWVDEYQEMYDWKFAELIIKECISQCNDGDSRYFIATHFGIPEPRGWLCPSSGVEE